MRVFLAIDLHDAVAPAAQAWGRAVADRLAAADRAALSWVTAERIHLTLRFYGELTPGRVEALTRALAEPAWLESAFTLGLGHAGTFPPAGRPRALWLGVGDGRDAVSGLHRALAARPGAGTGGAEDAFAPHVTIARVRRPRPGIARALGHAMARTPVPTARTLVRELTLFESVPAPRAVTYVALARFPLAGAIG
jgi:RNA 2',3'-cyclic 3'-phosphodiesterase